MPVLGFEFTLPGTVADHSVYQEVMVRVLPEQEAALIIEPPLPEPEFQIELPGQQIVLRLKQVLEKMGKNGAEHIAIEAIKDPAPAGAAQAHGERATLRLVSEAEIVSVATTFPSFALVTEGKFTPSPDGPVKLLLSLKRLEQVLGAFELVKAEAHIACVLQDHAFVLYALLPANVGSLIAYTPVVTL